MCHRFFVAKENVNGKDVGNKVCSICSDPNRDRTTLMIVARDSDFENVEKSGVYKGLYFILGGTVPILDKEPDKRIRLKTLLEYVVKSAQNLGKNMNELPIKEIILSLNTTSDGEHTATIVKESIQKIAPKTKMTVLGRGLSTGAELEYADSETIRNALSNRK